MAESETIFWKGRVLFDENHFQDRSRFPDITRTVRAGVGRQELTGGELRMQSDGIVWTAGSLFTPGGQLHGSFHLPWSVIVGMEANRMAYKLPVGGSLVIHLSGGPHLYGEFMGSLKRLREAIAKCPISPTTG
jgi:hypothetical protein